jgi:hypothetical protein
VALAHPPADAPPVPVTWLRVLPGVLLLLPVTTGRTQQALLPYGLRAGRHDVAARSRGTGAAPLWYPAACGRPAAAAASPCLDAPPDSGRFPLVVLDWPGGAPTAADTAIAEYLASHGFVVVGGSFARADLAALPFVDTTRSATGRLRGVGTLLVAEAGGWQLSVAAPPGPSDHIRASAAVTRAFLDAALRAGPASLPALARRLAAAGLSTRLARAGTGRSPGGS